MYKNKNNNIKFGIIAVFCVLSFVIPTSIFAEWEEVQKFGNGKEIVYIDNNYVKRSKFGNFLIRTKRVVNHADGDGYTYDGRKTFVDIDTFEIHTDFNAYRTIFEMRYHDSKWGGWSRLEFSGRHLKLWMRAHALISAFKGKERAEARSAEEKAEAERLSRLPATVDIVVCEKNAKISIDGKYKANERWKGELPKGKHSIVVSCQSHKDYKQDIVLSPGEEKIIEIQKLDPIVGAIYISSNPEGAKLFIDGKEVGNTPMLVSDLLIGSHEVKIVNDDDDVIVKNINIIELPEDIDEPQILHQTFLKNVTSGHQYVDLGLPSGTLWATCNLGADDPMDEGDLFGWGQITPSDRATPDKKESKNIKKHANNIVKSGIMDISGKSEYDAARAAWGGLWQMPTKYDFDELLRYCKFKAEPGKNGKPSAIRVIGKGAEMYIPLSSRSIKLMSSTAVIYGKGFKDELFWLWLFCYNNSSDVSSDVSIFSTECRGYIRPVFTPSPEFIANKRNSYDSKVRESAIEAYKQFKHKN